MEPAAVTWESTSSASLMVSRAKPPADDSVASPLTASVWLSAGEAAAARIRPAARHAVRSGQHRAIRAQARPSDQNPAAAPSAIPAGLSASTTRSAANVSQLEPTLELAGLRLC